MTRIGLLIPGPAGFYRMVLIAFTRYINSDYLQIFGYLTRNNHT